LFGTTLHGGLRGHTKRWTAPTGQRVPRVPAARQQTRRGRRRM